MKSALLILFAALQLTSFSQNLVRNPGLEVYITCPGFGQFSSSYIDEWDKPSWGSTDYYHYNCPGIIPSQQVPRTGLAYAGIICYNYGQEYREYMTGTLTLPLNPGAAYYCEFYVSLNDGYIQAIKEIGAYLSAAPPGPYSNALHIPLTPQVENTVNLLDDTSAWMRVSGYFLASGGEQYITIGNFNNDTNTTIVQVGNVGSYGAYYFVDDVWVSLAEGVGIPDLSEDAVRLFPNPAQESVRISLPLKVRNESVRVLIKTPAGAMVSEQNLLAGNGLTLDISGIAEGIYFAEIMLNGRRYLERFVKN